MVKYQKKFINGLNVFYREAGDPGKPVFLLLHGFPSASHMFRNLIPLLDDDYRIIAPDLIGFGQSEAPDHTKFPYTFEHLTDYVEDLLDELRISRFYMYVFDYGAPIGFRLAIRHPEKILGIVSQNGNIYKEGLGQKWTARKAYWEHPTSELRKSFESAFAPETIIGQYTTGENPDSISPDSYSLDIFYTHSSGYAERQDDLILDYRTNVEQYPAFQNYIREYQPELLAIWGRNDPSFIYPGAECFAKDDKNAHVVLLDAGHFALESHYKEISKQIINIFKKKEKR